MPSADPSSPSAWKQNVELQLTHVGGRVSSFQEKVDAGSRRLLGIQGTLGVHACALTHGYQALMAQSWEWATARSGHCHFDR